jgi:hypothetical protein
VSRLSLEYCSGVSLKPAHGVDKHQVFIVDGHAVKCMRGAALEISVAYREGENFTRWSFKPVQDFQLCRPSSDGLAKVLPR